MDRTRILKQKKVLITREKSQATEFASLIESHGGIAVSVPLLQITCRNKTENKLPEKLATYEWIFFTSAHGVHCFFKQCKEEAIFLKTKFATVGHKTEKALKKYGFTATFIPSTYNAEVMAAEFFETYPEANDILLVRGSISRKLLVTELTDRKLHFDTLIVYNTTYDKDMKSTLLDVLANKRLDYVTFTSPSTVRAFMEIIERHPRKTEFLQIPAVCIGTTTERAAIDLEFTTTITPDMFTIESMVKKMLDVEKNNK